MWIDLCFWKIILAILCKLDVRAETWRKRNWLGACCNRQIKGIAHLARVVATKKWFLLAIFEHRCSSVRGSASVRGSVQAFSACAFQCTVAGWDLESVMGYGVHMLCYSLFNVNEYMKCQKACSCVKKDSIVLIRTVLWVRNLQTPRNIKKRI